MNRPLDPELSKAVEFLRGADPVLAPIIAKVGPCRIAYRRQRFHALAESILYQQVTGAAAASIYKRLCALYAGRRFPRAAALARTHPMRLRSAGLSRQKRRYLLDLARKVSSGALDLKTISRLPDEEVIEQLTRVKGIGRWTAEMFLIFCLKRLDVLPVDDLGLQKGVQEAYGFRSLPAARTIRRIGEAWRPFRSIGTWYLWQSLNKKVDMIVTSDQRPVPGDQRPVTGQATIPRLLFEG
ncbi:MAG TPA: DNA-3-methyladenine glycosylase [Candidatus Acidoferrales bacterium]